MAQLLRSWWVLKMQWRIATLTHEHFNFIQSFIFKSLSLFLMYFKLSMTAFDFLWCSQWQKGFQGFLVVMALLCVPWMMFGKPFYLRYQHKYKQVNSWIIRPWIWTFLDLNCDMSLSFPWFFSFSDLNSICFFNTAWLFR